MIDPIEVETQETKVKKGIGTLVIFILTAVVWANVIYSFSSLI